MKKGGKTKGTGLVAKAMPCEEKDIGTAVKKGCGGVDSPIMLSHDLSALLSWRRAQASPCKLVRLWD
jgi:hypothetical protein